MNGSVCISGDFLGCARRPAGVAEDPMHLSSPRAFEIWAILLAARKLSMTMARLPWQIRATGIPMFIRMYIVYRIACTHVPRHHE